MLVCLSENSKKNLENPQTFFVFVLQCIHKEKMFTIEIEIGR